jgi:stage IV sporulation protein FB
MPNTFKEFLRFPEVEKAAVYTAALEKNGIAYELDDSLMRFGVVSMESPWEKQYILKVKDEDLEKATMIFNREFEETPEADEAEKPYEQTKLMKEYSDAEILDILINRKEWSSELVAQAKIIAIERKLELPEMDDALLKPVEEVEKKPWTATVYSLLVSFLAYYILFDQNISLIIVLLAVIFIHELGHFIAMKVFAYTDVKMFFVPMLGALVSGSKRTVSQRQRSIITLAGPVPGIIIGTVLYWLGMKNDDSFIIRSANIFIFLNAFNLLPLTPLDGGRLIETLFFSVKDKLRIIFIVISGVLLVWIAYYLKSYWLLIIPLLMLIQIPVARRRKKVKAALDAEGINYNKPYEEITPEEYWKIRRHIIANTDYLKEVNPDEKQFSKKESVILAQVKSLEDVTVTRDLNWIGKTIFILLWFIFLVSPLLIGILVVASLRSQ